jgi:hypothetical protein
MKKVQLSKVKTKSFPTIDLLIDLT